MEMYCDLTTSLGLDLKCTFNVFFTLSCKLSDAVEDLLWVNETVAAADIGYLYGAVPVGCKSGGYSLCCFRHLDCKRIMSESSVL